MHFPTPSFSQWIEGCTCRKKIMFSFPESMSETLFSNARVCHLDKFPPVFFEVEKKFPTFFITSKFLPFFSVWFAKKSKYLDFRVYSHPHVSYDSKTTCNRFPWSFWSNVLLLEVMKKCFPTFFWGKFHRHGEAQKTFFETPKWGRSFIFQKT